MKSKTLAFVALACICLMTSHFSEAQRHVDLQFSVVYPQDNAIIPYGDTIPIKISVKNLGPDTIFLNEDSIYYAITVFPNFTLYNYANIPPLDSAIFTVLYAYSTEDTDVTDTICAYLLPKATTYIDSNPENDTACISFVLLGDTTTGIATLEAHQAIKLFPNPASGWVQMDMNTSGYHQLQLSVMDIYGRVVLSQDYGKKALENKNNLRFDATGFSPGVYFVRLRADDKTFMSKLVVR